MTKKKINNLNKITTKPTASNDAPPNKSVSDLAGEQARCSDSPVPVAAPPAVLVQ